MGQATSAQLTKRKEKAMGLDNLIDRDALIDAVINKTESPIIIIKAELQIGTMDHETIDLTTPELQELVDGGEDAQKEYLRKFLKGLKTEKLQNIALNSRIPTDVYLRKGLDT